MTSNRRLIFWAITIFLFGAFFYSVSDILFPFVTGLLIAYLFDPIADRMEASGVSRGTAAGIIIGSFFAILVASMAFLGPVLVGQLSEMVLKIPEYWDDLQSEFLPYLEDLVEDIDPNIIENAKAQAQDKPGQISSILSNMMGNMLQSGIWIFNIISLIALTPFIAFYILRDWDKFIKKIDSLLPRDYAQKIREQAQKVDDTISGFLRGQLNVCLILGVFYSISLTIAGLNFGFAVGLLSGLLCFIPYVGTMIGILIGAGIAFAQFGDDYTMIGIVCGIYLIGQIMEGNFLTPKIVGDKIGVHPAWLIFGMLAGGTLLGLVGVIISVPLTAIIGVLVKFALSEYEESQFYKKSVAKRKK